MIIRKVPCQYELRRQFFGGCWVSPFASLMSQGYSHDAIYETEIMNYLLDRWDNYRVEF